MNSEQLLEPLESNAEALAQSSLVGNSEPCRPDIIVRLNGVHTWFDQILRVCKEPPEGFEVVARWILDNDYQLVRALRHIEKDLPEHYFRQLSVLKDPLYVQLPRAYQLVHTLLYESRLQLSFDRIVQFVQAYQRHAILSEAELWAIPALLRIACMENLISGCGHLLDSTSQPFESNRVIQDNDCGDPTERASGAIASIVAISEINWHDFVDKTSQVEANLKSDPADVYTSMSRSTRTVYRQEVEKLARNSAFTEMGVAAELIVLASEQEDHRLRHIGYWLFDAGRMQLNAVLDYKPTLKERFTSFTHRHAGSVYVFLLSTVTVAALVLPFLYLVMVATDLWITILILIFLLVPALDIAVQFVHWWTPGLRPRVELHALDRHAAQLHDCQCAVVVPVIVNSAHEIDSLVEKLELRYLANTEKYLRFVLLSDLADAREERLSTDDEIEKALVSGIRRLNDRYPVRSSDSSSKAGFQGVDRFLLLHRSRRFNPCEDCWMGWERKRGKLEQFNTLVIEGWNDAFTLCEGDISQLQGSKYVISLDADTMLPPGSAANLVCTFEHPLNQPVIDVLTDRLIAGYTLLQPRIETLEMRESSSRFAHLFSGDSAIDIYSHAVSDFHQDWFGTGSYVGKGIYHVESFHRGTNARVPENRILSHDLFEGMHGRVALASNITLYESFPNTWGEHCSRKHRWIRGDWQLLSWLGRHVPGGSRVPVETVFSALDQWKLVDNLRRSVVPPVLLVFLLSAWSWFPGNAVFWTALALGAFAPYLVNETLEGLSLMSRKKAARGYLHELKEQAARWLVSVALIVPDAILSVDAIIRTVWRQTVSGRHLLQWTSSAQVSTGLSAERHRLSLEHLVWLSPLLSVLVAFWLFVYKPSSLPVAILVLVSWFVAPWLVKWLSTPRVFRRDTLTSDDKQFLRRVARRTWHYFDMFSGPEENWLPPDNYQSHASVGVAHRTSTTNIGLYLSSSLAACDLGFIGTPELAVRVGNVLDTLQQLPIHRGQLFNWYDTQTLVPLEPRYVSTVDNGNLAICLLAVKQGCLELTNSSVLSATRWQGLMDTFQVLRELIKELNMSASNDVHTHLDVLEYRLSFLSNSLSAPDVTAFNLREFEQWSVAVHALNKELVENTEDSSLQIAQVRIWMERFDHQLNTLLRDVHRLIPWILSLDDVPAVCHSVADSLLATLRDGYPLNEATETHENLVQIVDETEASLPVKSGLNSAERNWLQRVRLQLGSALEHQLELKFNLREVALRADRFAWSMDFAWLYDRSSRLFHIGYNVTAGMLDHNHYDLLASEARIASFFAIAKHDVPLEHWFHLGRPVVRQNGVPVLQSWNGSLFEYLMPPLFLPGKRNTLLGESESLAVKAQQYHAHKHQMPWGVSESAYGVTDADENYQYKAFGTPALGIRRGLGDDHVIAPYASMLALGVWPQAAVKNLRNLASLNALGDYGYIDALDFTSTRLYTKLDFRSVDTWMAHHQGMSLIAIVNVLCADLMPRRVLREPALNAVELLLQERIPWGAPTEAGRVMEPLDEHPTDMQMSLLSAWNPVAAHGLVQTHLLGNGRLSARITRKGGGGLYYKDMALTRVSNDIAQAHSGYRIHLRVANTGQRYWIGNSDATTGAFDVVTTFNPHSVEIVQRTTELTVRLETIVAPEENMDIRRLTLVNESIHERKFILTSYAEVVLAPKADDERHPAFSKLFIGSHEERDINGLSFLRRARDAHAATPVLLHRLVSDDIGVALTGWETDRHHWYDRDNRSRSQWEVPDSLSDTTGWTLDPIMALQVTITVPAGETRRLSFVTSVGENREALLRESRRFAMPALDRLFSDAPWVVAKEVAQLGLKDAELPQLQNLASLMQYPVAALRVVPPMQAGVLPEQSELWRFGLSGDLPFLLVRVHDIAETEILELLIRAQVLWRRRGLMLDIGVLRLSQAGYEDPLRERVMAILRDTHNSGWLGRNGGIHLIPTEQVSQRTLDIVSAAATLVLDTDRPLNERLHDALIRPGQPPYLMTTEKQDYTEIKSVSKPVDLLFDNGIGGFNATTSEYVIHLESCISTPAPWCNVLANNRFGTLVSENGLGCSWAQNSGEHRLTPWSNDPVLDPQGEQVWLRDEMTGDIWTVSPNNRPIESPIQVHHGFGYTRWLCNSHGLEQEQLVFVPVDDPVKIVRLRFTNCTGKDKRITATYYAEWVMEAIAGNARTHVSCDYDSTTQAIMARNHWNSEFAMGVAFLCATKAPHSVSGDRLDFLNLEDDSFVPEGLLRSDLGGGFTPGCDCCAAYQVHLDIPAHGDIELAFVLGEGVDQEEAVALIQRWKSKEQLSQALSTLEDFWRRTCGAVKVRSPDPAFDLLINGWLIYQSYSSRLYARAGFYQAGGAFGFRDQLQDVLACIPSDPRRVRHQILLAAGHQFEEGDVLHWWHPPSGRGVRTRISDDYLWLSYVTARYVKATGDYAVLDVAVPYLKAALLTDDEEDRYTSFGEGASGTLLDHCCRSIENGLRTGVHGLPLMGSGDWNDGMDAVGRQGKGESVWLGWFLIATITLMAPIAVAKGESLRVKRWQRHAAAVKQSIDAHGWDGKWFVRAFDDAGLPWGSSDSEECQIDVIAQAWGVLAGFRDEDRVIKALQAVDEKLIDRPHQIVRLLTPPFHETKRNPGYIKAYPPGIRENGGQYTHAAAWLGLAFSGIGSTNKAYEVFNMINPINHTKDLESVQRYAREPYVLSADIGGAGMHEGRGGWSWYTGAASWTWQLGVHGILGIEYLPGAVQLDPGIPEQWDHVEIMLVSGRSTLSLRIENPEAVGRGISAMTVDGESVSSNVVKFTPETGQRRVVIQLGLDRAEWLTGC